VSELLKKEEVKFMQKGITEEPPLSGSNFFSDIYRASFFSRITLSSADGSLATSIFP
jgi:hypothetical protein